MANRRYTSYAVVLIALFYVVRSCQPRTLNGQTQWTGSSIALMVAATFGLLVVEQRAIARATRPSHVCIKCRYDLSGLTPTAPCPECGTRAK